MNPSHARIFILSLFVFCATPGVAESDVFEFFADVPDETIDVAFALPKDYEKWVSVAKTNALYNVLLAQKAAEDAAKAYLRSLGFPNVEVSGGIDAYRRDVLFDTVHVTVEDEEMLRKALELPAKGIHIRSYVAFTNSVPIRPNIGRRLSYLSIEGRSPIVVPGLSGARLKSLSVWTEDGGEIDIRGLAGATIDALSFTGITSHDIFTPSRIFPLETLRSVTCKEIDFFDAPIDSVEHIGHMPLVELNLRRTNVASLEPFSEMTTLKILDIGDTQIADLSPLTNSALTKLSIGDCVTNISARIFDRRATLTLDASGSQLQTISDFAGFTFDTLNLSYTKLRDLSALRGATIAELDIHGTDVDDLSPLRDVRNLAELNVAGTKVRDLSALTVCTNLVTLDVSRTRVTDFSPLANLPVLEKLFACDVDVVDLSPLRNIESLKSLFFWKESEREKRRTGKTESAPDASAATREIKRVDIAPLSDLPAFERLFLSGWHIADPEVLRELKTLTVLCLKDTNIVDASPLSDLPALEFLELDYTAVTNLAPLANLPALRELSLRGTRVTDLSPLAKCPALEVLSISDSAVADLTPLKDMPSLTVWFNESQIEKGLEFFEYRRLIDDYEFLLPGDEDDDSCVGRPKRKDDNP